MGYWIACNVVLHVFMTVGVILSKGDVDDEPDRSTFLLPCRWNGERTQGQALCRRPTLISVVTVCAVLQPIVHLVLHTPNVARKFSFPRMTRFLIVEAWI
jgi:hypothetical protein